ncbi:hypothetical protein AV521_42030 [Streptomyces sp. IMTB 2501]|uniref:FG-GAP-like repeat-containing protein n=1 Tax=Streptomyces sp. IMTB 2501 TaxID=1776340 RepID=UPI00096BECED|nr:FG-GAP-like repeat-containing protein [Streptomyces sp. IMTB 2501]OLZ62422.1 hypothetical protein AV521_42030 [Streptomyces sp. IMTB 2501]
MASAVDPAKRKVTPNANVRQRGLAASMPTAEHFLGMKSVGTLFSYDKDPTTGEMQAHECTASVVESPGHNLILTAGHCAGGKAVFVPWYRTEYPLDKQEYGFYRVGHWFVDNRYPAGHQIKSKVSDLDFAFGSLAVSPSGKNAQDVVGANTLARTPGYNNNLTMVGYPKAAYDSEDHAVRCPVQTRALSGFYQIQALCRGMYGGVSGGPWFSKIDTASGTGVIVGSVGGYNGGGNDANVDYITYSPVHGDWFFRLYEEAKADQQKINHGSSYDQPPLPYSLGGGDTWQHAQLMASGDFNGKGRSDMIVVWTDGEVTLYNSDGQGNFTSERQLMAKNTTWPHAETITAGDFTGSNQADLLVRWSDGEVTLYGDVGSNGLNWAGTQMADPNKTHLWKYATQIAAGRFNAQQYATDLIVRWSDGEVTLYTNVSAGSFGQEYQLVDPDKSNHSWKDANLLTAGEFSGNQKWDLMVQWANGELDSYVGTGTSGLGSASRVQDANSTWTHNTVMTAGNFTGNGRTDDLVVRWSDGETTMYIDTTANHLGTEENLVPAA